MPITFNRKIIFASCFFVLAISRILASQVFPVYDDAFITFRYSANLVDGVGFVYNQNEWILGTTAPGFGIVSAFLLYLSLPIPLSVIIANILFDLCSMMIVFRLFSQLLPHKTDLPYINEITFTVIFSIVPILNRVCVGGMEMNAFLSLSLLAILIFTRRSATIAYLLGGTLYCLRPEAVILLVVFFVIEFRIVDAKSALRHILIALLPILVITALYYTLYSAVVPQSIIAKSQLEPKTVIDTLKGILFPDITLYAFTLLSVFGFFHLRKNRIAHILAYWPALYLLLFLIARPHIWSWYSEVIVFCITLFASIYIAKITAMLMRHFRLAVTQIATVFLLATPVVSMTVLYFVQKKSTVTSKVYESLAIWCANNSLSKKTILAYDIGVIGYYSKATIYDEAGLVFPNALDYTSTEERIDSLQPDYLFLNVTDKIVAMMQSYPMNTRYQPVVRFSKFGHSELRPVPSDCLSTWSQDYILYEKYYGK